MRATETSPDAGPDLGRRSILTRTCALTSLASLPGWLAGCAGGTGLGGQPGPPIEAPQYRAGDRWIYTGQDGWRTKTLWDETHQVTSVGPDGIAIEISYTGDVSGSRVERMLAPGQITVGALLDIETRRFQEQLQRYNYPLTGGKSWNQWVDQFDDSAGTSGPINYFLRVGDWEKVTTPAGSFDAVRLRVFMQLADETFWRYATRCNYLLLYAPAVRGLVQQQQNAEYREKGGPQGSFSTVRTKFAQIDLLSFTPGR